MFATLLFDHREETDKRARAMSKRDYEYLLSLPLVLHAPSEHAFFVHAGLLPYDPTHSIASKRQPLAHLPKTPKGYLGNPLPTLRNVQELAILDDIKQNNNPWVVLNIRNLLKNNTVSRLVAYPLHSLCSD